MVQRAAGLVLSHFSRVRLCNPMTVAHEAPLSMEFSRQEYWSELPFSSPGDLPDPGIEPESAALQADFLPSEPPGKLHPALCVCHRAQELTDRHHKGCIQLV